MIIIWPNEKLYHVNIFVDKKSRVSEYQPFLLLFSLSALQRTRRWYIWFCVCKPVNEGMIELMNVIYEYLSNKDFFE